MRSGLCVQVEVQRRKDAEAGIEIAKLLEGKINRKVCSVFY